MMQYPSYPTQPQSGGLPSPEAFGPGDLHPAGTNHHYDAYNLTRGRYLGSLGQAPPSGPAQFPSADRNIKDYPNELDALAELDDVQGNGIFDAPGTHGNIHPEEGIFADRESLPGYLAREQFFAPSEVVDVNTGEPVMYVPGNAFMLDPRTQWMLDQVKLYEPGLPSTGGHGVPQVSTVEPGQPAWPVRAYGQTDEKTEDAERAKRLNMFLLAGVAGLSIGLVAGLVTKR